MVWYLNAYFAEILNFCKKNFQLHLCKIKFMDLLFIVLGFLLLVFGGDMLLKSAIGISLRLNIPKIVIGMTVVSFATSLPELIVSVNAALDGHPDIALGNVIGSNIANLGLVLAITNLLSPILIKPGFYQIDWPVMMISSVLLCGFIAFDGVLQRYEGVILFSFLIIFMVFLLKFQKPAVEEEVLEYKVKLPLLKIILFLVIGGIALWIGSELLIDGAVGIAKRFNVSERVIGVTIISVGTSVPELAASVIAVLKKEKGISIGNLIGSNVFNILGVLGLTAIIAPINIIDKRLLTNDIFWMLATALIVLPLSFMFVRMKLGWKEGLIQLFVYSIFIYGMFF